jgi:hypothetical protein
MPHTLNGLRVVSFESRRALSRRGVTPSCPRNRGPTGSSTGNDGREASGPAGGYAMNDRRALGVHFVKTKNFKPASAPRWQDAPALDLHE